MSYAKWLPLLLIGTLMTHTEVWACEVVATGVYFGSYDSTASQTVTGTGFLQLTCPQPAIIRLNAGLHSQGAFTARQLVSMNQDGDLRYNLYLEPTALRIWGDGSANTVVEQVPAGVSHLTIYGQIPGGQKVPVGTYSDNVTVTIEW